MSLKTDLCRICLACNVRLHTISDTPLQTMFERVTNTPLRTADSRPVSVCYICCAQLKRCLNLVHTSIKAEKMLTKMLQHNPEGSQKVISMLDHNTTSLSRSLCITPVDCIDTFSFNAPITVKEETEYLPNVKLEMDHEESIDFPQLPKVSDIGDDKLDLKDADVLRSIQLEQEFYRYKVKTEPIQDDSWQDERMQTTLESKGQIQVYDSDLLGKKKKKHAKAKRKRKEKHLKKLDDLSIKTEEPVEEQYNKSKDENESQNQPKTNTANKYFECEYCHYQSHRKCHLETHMSVHKGEKLLRKYT